MSEQVKLPAEVKKEVALYATISGIPQGKLLAASWREYKERHPEQFQEGLKWARGVLADPHTAAVAASGMSPDDLAEIQDALA
jgi:hypothetical protein